MSQSESGGTYAPRKVQCVMLTGVENIWTLVVGPDERVIGAVHEGNTAWVYIEGPDNDE